MTAIAHSPNPYLPVFPLGGGTLEGGRNGVLLTVGTFFVAIASDTALLSGCTVQWDATLAMTITVEDTCNPDVAVNSNVAGDGWVQENPSTAYVGGTGSGGLSVVNLTLTIAGGTAGGAGINLGNSGMLRTRLRVVVTTGGRAVFSGHGKA